MTTKSHKPSKTRWGLILHLRFSALPTLVLKKINKLYAELLTLKMQKLTMKEKNSKSPSRYPTVNVRLTQLYFVNCSNYFLSQSMQDVLRYCMSVAKAN